jgi:hypothetical protein
LGLPYRRPPLGLVTLPQPTSRAKMSRRQRDMKAHYRD